MRRIWAVAFWVAMLAGVANAAPAAPAKSAPVWTQTAGKSTISVTLPRDMQLQSPGLYAAALGDPKGRPVVRIEIRLAASAERVPKTPAEVRTDVLGMMHNMRLPIKDTEVSCQMLPPTANATLDVAYGGFYKFKKSDGQMVILSPNVFIGKKKELVAPFTIVAVMLDKKSGTADIERVQKYLEGALREMVRSAALHGR